MTNEADKTKNMQGVIAIITLELNCDYIATSKAINHLLQEGWAFNILTREAGLNDISFKYFISLRRVWEVNVKAREGEGEGQQIKQDENETYLKIKKEIDATHTYSKGDWILQQSSSKENGIYCLGHGFICFLPKVEKYSGQEERYVKELKEGLANARLISASPVLLEACKKALIFIQYAKYMLYEGKGKMGSQFPYQEDADIEIKKIEQAISKAE